MRLGLSLKITDIVGFTPYLFPPDFSDDATDPSTLLTYETKTTTDQVGDTVAPAGWSRKARGYNVAIGDEIAITGTTLTQGGGTAVLAHDGTKVTVTTGGTLWGFDVDGEMFYCADATLAGDGGFCVGDGGTAAPITTTDIVAFHVEFTDGVSGIDLNTLGFSIGTGIYDGQFIPPHADNPNLDAFGNPLQYRPRLKYDLELVDSTALSLVGSSYLTLDSLVVLAGDFTLSWEQTYADDGSVYQVVFGLSTANASVAFKIDVSEFRMPFHTFSGVLPEDGEYTVTREGTSLTLTTPSTVYSALGVATTDVEIDQISKNQFSNFFSGSLWNLNINNQHRYPCIESSGDIVEDVIGSNNATITTADITGLWSGKQSTLHYAVNDGFSVSDGISYFYDSTGLGTIPSDVQIPSGAGYKDNLSIGKVGVLTDLHYTSVNGRESILDDSLSLFDSAGCDKVVLLGDIIDTAIDRADSQSQISSLDSVISSHTSDVDWMIGNHEVTGTTFDDFVTDSQYTPAGNFTFDIDNFRFISVETSSEPYNKTSDNSIAWLSLALSAANADGKDVFVLTHCGISQDYPGNPAFVTSEDIYLGTASIDKVIGDGAVITSSDPVFSPGTVGLNLFIQHGAVYGLATVISYIDDYNVTVNIDQDFASTAVGDSYGRVGYSDYGYTANKIRSEIDSSVVSGLNVLGCVRGHGHVNDLQAVNGIDYYEFATAINYSIGVIWLYRDGTYRISGISGQDSYSTKTIDKLQHEKAGILNGAYVSYQKPQAPQVIRADQTADVAGTGPVWFDALGNQNKLTEADIDLTYNLNDQYYRRDQDIWEYTVKLNADQATEVVNWM